MKIYVITAGDYSDYHICAVTDDKKSAERLRKIHSSYWQEASIETYDTKYIYEDPKSYWYLEVNLDGSLSSYTLLYFNEEDETKINEVELYNLQFHINVIAKDFDHALKIAFDTIAKYKYEHMEEVADAVAEKRRWDAWFAMNGMASSASIW